MSEIEEIPDALKALVEEPVAEAPEKAPEPPPEPEPKEPEPEVDPLVQKASTKGWRPKDEYQGDPDEWVDAGEFLRRQPLFERARAAEKRAKDLEKKLEGTVKLVDGIEERVRKQTLEEIAAKRRQAVEDGDIEAFEQADKAYEEAQKPVVSEEVSEEVADELPPEVTEFAKRNAGWFEKNYLMTDEAVKATTFYRGQGNSLEKALELAEADIKRKYPEHFENPNKKRAQSVSESTKETRTKTRTYNDLTSEEKAVYAALKGKMKLEEFITELEKQSNA